MAHLTLISDTTPTSKTSRTDTRLIKMCKLYLLELQHLGKLRREHAEAQTTAAAVLRDRPENDPEAAKLWWKCWYETDAYHLERGIEYGERKLTELLIEIFETPAHSEAGMRARLQVWRVVLVADDADRLLDSIVSNMAAFRRRRV